jgi:hypothetical protein
MLLPIVVITMATVVLTITLRIPAHVAGSKERCNYSSSHSDGVSTRQCAKWIQVSTTEDAFEIWRRQSAVADEDWLSLHRDNQLLGNFLYPLASHLNVLKVLMAATDGEQKVSILATSYGSRAFLNFPEHEELAQVQFTGNEFGKFWVWRIPEKNL